MTEEKEDKESFIYKIGVMGGTILVILALIFSIMFPFIVQFLIVASLMSIAFLLLGWEFNALYAAGVLVLAYLIRFVHKIITD